MKSQKDPPYIVEFFASRRGESPPKEFISGLPAADRAKIGMLINLLRELGPAMRMPHAKQLKGHKPLWELRPMPTRLIYVAWRNNRFMILHAFTKKSNQTPSKEIEVAERRLAELLEREKK